MIEVMRGLVVGDERDADRIDPAWCVLQAAKEPFHRRALGYSTKAAPQHSPEYLFAFRNGGKRMVLNFVDADDKAYIPQAMIKAAIVWMNVKIHGGETVFVHCNKGESRAPMLAMIYLRRARLLPANYDEAEAMFLDIYPRFNPGVGVEQYLREEFAKPIKERML